MLSPGGGEEKLGSQILLLIDTWVNIILAEGKGKKRSMLVFLSRSRDGQGEKLKTQSCDINGLSTGPNTTKGARAGQGERAGVSVRTREPQPSLLSLAAVMGR